MTKNEAIENHRKMWNWIADETLRMKRKVIKYEYFMAMGIPEDDRPIYHCYCCEYAKDECDLCPIKWFANDQKEEKKRCDDLVDGLYAKWYWYTSSLNYEDAAKYARMIAELPEKE